MTVSDGVKILVQDWYDLHEDGGTTLSVGTVAERLRPGKEPIVDAEMGVAEMAEAIVEHLREIPGALGSARVFFDGFDSAADLLEEIDLDCFVSDLSAASD